MPNSLTWIIEGADLPYFGTVKRHNGQTVFNEFNSAVREDIFVRVHIVDGQHYVLDDNELALALLAFAAVPATRAATVSKGMRRGLTAKERLNDLGFDPAGALVDKYLQLEAESVRQSMIRDTRDRLGDDLDAYPKEFPRNVSGKPQAYYLDNHLNVIGKQVDIANALLKYGYSPAVATPDKQDIPALVIELDSEEYFTVMAEDSVSYIEQSDSLDCVTQKQ